MHPQADASFDALERDGVVEVLRVGGVDRHREEVAKVLSTTIHLARDVLSEHRCRLRDVRGKLGPQAVLTDDDLHVHARLVLATEHFLDDALRGVAVGRIPYDPCDDDLSGLRHRPGRGQVDEDIALDTGVARHHDAETAMTLEASDDAGASTLDDLDDLASAAEPVAFGLEADGDGVAVHRTADVAFADVDVARLGAHEAEATPIHREPTDEQSALTEREVPVVPDLDDTA